MTAKKAPPSTVDDEGVDVQLVTTAPDDWEFETIVDESPTRVLFTDFGDTFVGEYLGIQHIEQPVDEDGKDQSFDLHNFRGRDGGLYALNDNYKLNNALQDYKGEWMRLTYVRDIPVKKGNPMKDIKVEIRTNYRV